MQSVLSLATGGETPSIYSVAPTLLALYGVLKCIQLSRREGVSRLGMISLGLVCGGWLLVSSARWIAPAGRAAAGRALAMSALGLLLAGFVVAIVALATYDTRRHTRGRKKAIWAIVLVSVFAALVAAVRCGPSGRPLRAVAPGAGPLKPAAGQRDFPDTNCRFVLPGRPWEDVGTRFHADARLGLVRAAPEIVFALIPETLGAAAGFTVEGYAEIAAGVMRSRAGDVRSSRPRPYQVGTLDGLRVDSDIVVEGNSVSIVQWFCVRNGYAYQMIASAPRTARDQLHDTIGDLFEGFSQIDPDLVYYGESFRPFGRAGRPAYGFTLDLAGTAWGQWEDTLSKDYPQAIAGGLTANGEARLILAPISYGGLPRPHDDALLTVGFRCVGLDWPGPHLDKPVERTIAGMRALTFTHDNPEFDARHRTALIIGDTMAWLVTVWTGRNDPNLDRYFGQVERALSLRSPYESDLPCPYGAEPNPFAAEMSWLGAFYFQSRQYPRALEYARKALDLDPAGPGYLCDAAMALSMMDRPADALELVEGYPALAQVADVKSWRAYLLMRLDRGDESLDLYRELFAGGFRNDEDFGFFLDLLIERERWEEAEQRLADYAKGGDSQAVELRRVEILLRHGKLSEAAAALANAREAYGFDPSSAYQLIDLYTQLEQPRQALAVCDELISRGHGSAEAHYRRALSQYDLKWYREAKQSVEQALRQQPNHQAAREFLTFVSGMLGEGNNSDLLVTIEPVAMPPCVAEHLPPLDAAPSADGYGSYYLYNITGVSFERDRRQTRTVRQRIKVVDAGAVSQYSTLQAGFDPLAEEVCLNEVVIRDAEGREVSRVQRSDCYVVDAVDGDVASHDRTLNIPLPNLAPGHLIDLTYTKRTLGKAEEFSYYCWTPLTGKPVLTAGVFYLGAADAIRSRGLNVPPAAAFDGGLAWILRDLTWRLEPMQAPLEQFAPLVMLCDARSQWPGLVEEYLQDIADKLAADPAVGELAARLTATCQTDRQKADALLCYVRDTLVYKPIEFGRRARVPQAAAETLRRKYGDCKDHSVLLMQMMRSVGLPASLALVSTGTEVAADLPSLDPFDHMVVVCAEAAGRCRVLDATAKGLSVEVSPIWGDVPRRVLVLDASRPRFEMAAPARAGDSAVHVRRTVDASGGPVVVNERVRLTGVMAQWMRDFAREHDRPVLEQWAGSVVTSHVRLAVIKSIELRNLDGSEAPLEIEVVYEAPGSLTSHSDGSRLRLAAPWEREYFERTAVADRLSPWAARWAWTMDSATEVIGAPGSRLDAPAVADADGSEGPLEWHSRFQDGPGKGTLTLTATHSATTHAADRYAPYCQEVSKALSAIDRELLLRTP
ncbi:MAG: DUF3857 domain-containing protein [Planctomycetes bacterium]|nr:DUF3857 domain-containing protein [Planctomycetota bacterium]